MEPKRIRHACSRCRRQKLRCDSERPCPLCVRANVQCTEATERTWRSNRPRSAVYQARQARQTQPRERRSSSIHVRSPAAAGIAATTSNASLQDTTTSHAEPEDAGAPDQRASALHLVGKIFQKYHISASNRTREIDAIPSSDSPEDGSTPFQAQLMPVVDLLGIDLPPMSVVNTLLDAYRDTVHWYLHVLHEPSLRARLRPIVETGLASRQQRPLLLLALIVLVIGARFISDDTREKMGRVISLDDMTSKMMITVERCYLPAMELITVDTIAYSYLLSTYYLWNRQTKPSFITMGTTIRAAQFIGLNREAQWGNVDAIEQEARRCIWWAVVIGAGFISMSWGTPPMVSEADCNVGQPRDVEDTAEQCPGFGSLEQRDDGEFRPVTLGSYNRYKADMYKIAISIMRQVYFTKHHGPEELVQVISKLHHRLLAWEKSIPPELRVESHPPISLEEDHDHDGSLQRIFAIQALTLRVSYDNVQIFLFRPLISIGGVPRSHGCTRENSPSLPTRTNSDGVPSSFINVAQQQCWTSAMRTSLIAQRSDILQLSLFELPATHVGVHSFSAGVMLGLLALLEPLSTRGQESKRAIARIIQIPRATKLRSHVWTQMTEILTDLMHVIAAEETKALIANPAGIDFSEAPAKLDTFGQPPNHLYQGSGTTEFAASIANYENSDGNQNHVARQPVLQGLLQLQTDETHVSQDRHQDGVLDHVRSGVANHPPQNHSPDPNFDVTDLWGPVQAGWSAGSLHGMDQLWIWDACFPYLSFAT